MRQTRKILFRALVFAAILPLTQGCKTMNQPSPAPQASAKRVTGVGGIFFKCDDPEQLKRWYSTHLGLATDAWGTNFEWRQADDPARKGFTQWGPFRQDAKKFGNSKQAFMINYRVENLDRLLEQLRAEGVEVVGEVESVPYGKFCHVLDGEGNMIELWEPIDLEYDKIVEGRTR